MRNALKCIAAALSISIGLATAPARAAAPEPAFWFRHGAQPPPLVPVQGVPEAIRKLEPIADPADPQVIARNLFAVVGSVPTDGLCLSVGLMLLPFQGDPGFFHPFLLWLPYTVRSEDVYGQWGSLSRAAQASTDPYQEGPVKRWHDAMSSRSLRFASPRDLMERNTTEASVELIEARFARRGTIEDYLDAQPWRRDGNMVVAEGCSPAPLSAPGGHSSLAEAYLFVRVGVFFPFMVNSGQLPADKRELWRQHQNELMMHEFVHLHSLLRILSESAAQLRAQAEHDRLAMERQLALDPDPDSPESRMIRAAMRRPKPLDPGDRQLEQYLEFIKRRFDEDAMSYHAFLGDEGDGTASGASRRRHDNSGDLPPYMDMERARARLQREFDTHWKQVRAVYPDLPETPPQ